MSIGCQPHGAALTFWSTLLHRALIGVSLHRSSRVDILIASSEIAVDDGFANSLFHQCAC